MHGDELQTFKNMSNPNSCWKKIYRKNSGVYPKKFDQGKSTKNFNMSSYGIISYIKNLPMVAKEQK